MFSYFGAHHFLLYFLISTFFFQRAGAVFPQRSERSAPVFTPPQTQPLSSIPPNLRNPEYRQEGAETSTESEFPTLRYFSRLAVEEENFCSN